jgi:hypothetical protein
MTWQRALIVLTFSGIFAINRWAHAEEPPSVDGGAAVDLAPAAPTPVDVVEPALPGEPVEPAEPNAPVKKTRKPSSQLPGNIDNAEIAATPARPADPAATGDEGGKGKKRKGGKIGKTRFGAFEIKGRVLVRGEYDRSDGVVLNDMLVPVNRTVESLDLSVPSARLQLQYQAPMEWLTAVAELDLAGQPDMKDGYLQAKDEHFALRVGQFRVPVASVETMSPWALPIVRRGTVRDVLVDRMDYGGRRPGVSFVWRDRDMVLHPRLTVAAFQGAYLAKPATPTGRDTDLLNGMKFPSQTVVARAEVEIMHANVGAYYENRIGSPALFQTDRYWAAGADLYYDRVFESGGFRLWADGIVGSSWYEHASKRPDGKDALFAVGRAMAAYRFGGTTDESLYVEPFALGAVIDPDVEVTDDRLWEGVVGVNAGSWKRARVTVQAEINKGQRNFPVAVFAGPPPDRMAIILQAGVAF